jgi:hypothetical protein
MKNAHWCILILALCGGGCGGQLGDGTDSVTEAATGIWNEPYWHIAEYRGCYPSGDCNSIDYFVYPQFKMTAADWDSTHASLISINDWEPHPNNVITGCCSNWVQNYGWVQLVSAQGRTINLWPNPSHGGWGSYEFGCLTQQGDWCINHGSNNAPLYNLTGSAFPHPDYTTRVVHHEQTTYKFDEDSHNTTWLRACYYDLTNRATGTWTRTGCYSGQ